MSAEIQAWYEEYQQKQQAELAELRRESFEEGRREGMRRALLRQLRYRFGELPAAAITHVEAGEVADIERWADRVLTAQLLDDVLDEPT